MGTIFCVQYHLLFANILYIKWRVSGISYKGSCYVSIKLIIIGPIIPKMLYVFVALQVILNISNVISNRIVIDQMINKNYSLSGKKLGP